MRAHDGPTIITNDDHHRCRPGQQLGGGRGGEEGKGVGRTKRTSLGNLAVLVATVVLVTTFLVVPVGAGPRYSSRIVETKSGAIRGVILELNSKYLEPVEVSWIDLRVLLKKTHIIMFLLNRSSKPSRTLLHPLRTSGTNHPRSCLRGRAPSWPTPLGRFVPRYVFSTSNYDRKFN